MKNITLSFWLSIVVTGSVLLNPPKLQAQATNAAHVTRKVAAASTATDKKPSAHPFHGRLTKIDKVGKSIMVGKTTYYVGPDTKIKKDGQTAALEEGVIDEQVTGYVKPDDSGRMVASTVNFGGKGSTAKKEKPHKTESKPPAAIKVN
jgi:hypothetical protein